MSTNRKFRRAQKAKPEEPAKAPAKNREQLRRQLSEQRFATAGSDRLWPALLGWSPPRISRAWLLDSVHDAARLSEQGSDAAGRALSALQQRAPEAAERLGPADIARAAAAWANGGDVYEPQTPGPHWLELAQLCERAGLGAATPRELQEDWEIWISLALASQPRQQLLASLAQTEQAALALLQATQSDNAQALATLARLSWVALAYGDADAFARLRRHSAEWLKGELPPAPGAVEPER